MKAFVLAGAISLAISSLASAVVIRFDATDYNQFAGTVGTWARQTGSTPASTDGYLKWVTGNGAQQRTYSPADGFTMGAGTVSLWLDPTYGGGTATYQAGLMLQKKSGTEYYAAILNLNNGNPQLKVGNVDNYGSAKTGHTGPKTVSLTNDTYTPGTAGNPGWWHLTATVGDDGSGHYQAIVNLVSPLGNTYSTTYIDTGANQYTTAYPLGLFAYGQNTIPQYFDELSFQPVPEPATVSLIVLGGLVGLLRRRSA